MGVERCEVAGYPPNVLPGFGTTGWHETRTMGRVQPRGRSRPRRLMLLQRQRYKIAARADTCTDTREN